MLSVELVEKLRDRQRQWRELQPLELTRWNKLWLKLRLEWNYNSNHIEGNTLTYGETELLLIHGDVRGEHTFRELVEMQAHDVAIKLVQEYAADGRELTVADIRDWNRVVLKEPFWKEVITPSGERTRKQIFPGEYKTTPNHVRTATGEIFRYATPEEVPPKMLALAEEIRAGVGNSEISLPEFLAKIHHDFLLIHPFDDGNGRVGRLILNYVLLRQGLLPLVIKSADKQAYFRALRRADAKDLSALAEFLAQAMVESLELGVKVATEGI